MENIYDIMEYIFDYMQYMYYIMNMKDNINMKMKLARVEKNLSQQQLAELINVTRQTIGLIEKGKYNPTLNLCVKIAKALNKTLDQIFWENNQNEESI